MIPSFLTDIETVGIIGTAGRKDDIIKLSLDKFNLMYEIASGIIGDNKVHIISGGAPWADHIAVRLFLNSPLKHELTIEFPCKFGSNGYVEGEEYDGYNIAETSKYYHQLFFTKTGIDGIGELKSAIAKGAQAQFSKGFFDRNNKVSHANKLIAFTFGDGPKVKKGGTSHTVDCYIANGGKDLYHINLNEMKIYTPLVT